MDGNKGKIDEMIRALSKRRDEDRAATAAFIENVATCVDESSDVNIDNAVLHHTRADAYDALIEMLKKRALETK